MKKYFIAETEEEIAFGEVIQVDLIKKTKHGEHTFKSEIEFSPTSLPLLSKAGVIEEREIEEEEVDTDNTPLIDFDDEETCGVFEGLLEDFEALEKRVDRIEDLTVGTCNELMALVKVLIKETKEQKPEPQKKPSNKK